MEIGMSQLSAFVGHSFLEVDEVVVSRIHTMLNSISTLMPEFTWDHAQSAEPKVLSQKVKEKMQGKNLFIGICTAKENAILSEDLKLSFFRWIQKDILICKRSKLQSKTSDWIIQEIGMAVGRDMQLVLLIEEGVRMPGGLQGDLEYIAFRRDQPERCYEKLAEMLRSLIPVSPKIGESQQVAAAVGVSKAADVPDSIPEFLIPAISWTAADYISRYGIAIAIGQEQAIQKILKAFGESPFVDLPDPKAAFEATAISARADFHHGEWVVPLQELLLKYPNTEGPHKVLAGRYEEASDHALAAKHYELAAGFSKVILSKVRLLIDAAEQNVKAGTSGKAHELLSQATELIHANPNVEKDGMVRLAEYWKAIENIEMYTACLERALELAPDAYSSRFDLAYKYSEMNLENHALFHYRQHLKINEDPSARNNLGVSAIANKLPITGISAYEKAHVEGNTLATSNLVFALLEAGFLRQAAELCDEGLRKPEPNPRLYEAKARCDRALTEESEKEAKILETTSLRRAALRSVGRSSILKVNQPIPERWLDSQCELTAVVTESRFVLKGSFTRKEQGTLGGLLLGKFEAVERRYTVLYEGVLVGHSFVGTVKTNSDTQSSSLLGGDSGKECIGTLDQSLRSFEFLIGRKDKLTLKAIG
jgi:tetratricopeptide (TPR) repeat protein